MVADGNADSGLSLFFWRIPDIGKVIKLQSVVCSTATVKVKTVVESSLYLLGLLMKKIALLSAYACSKGASNGVTCLVPARMQEILVCEI